MNSLQHLKLHTCYSNLWELMQIYHRSEVLPDNQTTV